MNNRGVAVIFLLTLLTALVALYQDAQFDARLAQQHTVALTAERELGSLDVALASVRAAQSIYAPGTQNLEAAFGRVTELLDTMESTLQARQKAASGPELAARYDAALQSLAEVRNLDVRARAALSRADGLNAGHMSRLMARRALTSSRLMSLKRARWSNSARPPRRSVSH